MAIKEPAGLAIDQVRKAFPECEVRVREDGDGGAYLTIDSVNLGDTYSPSHSWIGFRITFQYPYADCYPHYVCGNLARTDGNPIIGEGIQAGQAFEGRSALQISRRSNRLNPEIDTALLKLQKVIVWLRSHQ